MADNARMATDSSKSPASQAKNADAPADAANTAAQLTLPQWCALTGQVPHRIRAFAAQVTNPGTTCTADAWAAQFADFNKQPI